MPASASAWAKGTRPVLSQTESNARWIRAMMRPRLRKPIGAVNLGIAPAPGPGGVGRHSGWQQLASLRIGWKRLGPEKGGGRGTGAAGLPPATPRSGWYWARAALATAFPHNAAPSPQSPVPADGRPLTVRRVLRASESSAAANRAGPLDTGFLRMTVQSNSPPGHAVVQEHQPVVPYQPPSGHSRLPGAGPGACHRGGSNWPRPICRPVRGSSDLAGIWAARSCPFRPECQGAVLGTDGPKGRGPSGHGGLNRVSRDSFAGTA